MAKEREITMAFVDGGELVQLYRRPEGDKVYARRGPAEYCGFIRRDDIGAELMRDLRISSTIRGIVEEGQYYRVSWVSNDARFGFATHPDSPLVKAGVEVLEGDVDPVRRFLTDHPEVKLARPRRCYLDIETDSRKSFADKEEMRLLVWSIVDHETGALQRGVLVADTDKDERRLLDELWGALEPFDQVAGWYLDGFDAPVIFARAKRQRCRADARRWLWVDQLEVFKTLHQGGDSDDKRSMRLEDVGQSVTGRGKLQAPAFVVERFGDRALGSLSWDLWEAGGEFRSLLVDYCGRDTQLLREIEQRTGYLDLMGSVCEVCRLPANTKSLDNLQQMDGYLLQVGRRRNYRFPTKQHRETGTKFKGAYVMKPLTLDPAWRKQHGMRDGIARNVHVFDFSSMYPSIIRSWNMGSDTKLMGPPNGPIPEGACRSLLTGVLFRTDAPSILVEAITELMKLRVYWNDLKATLPPGTPEWEHAGHMSQAYKITVLAFYGGTGSIFSRFFDRQVAESTTQCGVGLLKRTLHEAERVMLEALAIYGDSDSGFVMGVERDVFVGFVRWCNAELYPAMLKEQGCRSNHVKLAYEKEFERLVLCGAKKYCGSYRHYKWMTTCGCTTPKGQPGALDVKTMTCRDCGVRYETLPPIRSAPEIRGLEYRRGDTLKLAVDLQAHCIDLLVGGMGIDSGTVPTDDPERYHAILSRARQRVLEQPLALEDVQQSKSLSRPLKEYAAKIKQDGTDAAQPPHVVIAKILKQRGRDVREGTRIEYFVADGNVTPLRVMPAEDWKGECDRYYLWESLVYPPTQRLLEAAYPAQDWAAWAKVRPAKVRAPSKAQVAKAARAAGGDAGPLFAAVLAQRQKVAEPYVIEIVWPRQDGLDELIFMQRVKDVLARHPGERQVVLRIKQAAPGWDADLLGKMWVSGSAAMVDDLRGVLLG